MPYRDVMALALKRVAHDEGLALDPDERGALGASLPSWPAFPEVAPALEEARRRGWKLAILSNTDRDFIEASNRRIGGDFELEVLPSDIGSCKAAPGHWEHCFEGTGAS